MRADGKYIKQTIIIEIYIYDLINENEFLIQFNCYREIS